MQCSLCDSPGPFPNEGGSVCKSCIALRKAEWFQDRKAAMSGEERELDAERKRTNSRAYYASHREQVIEKQIAYYHRKNRERGEEREREWGD
jgi:hypothetical protein